MRLLKSGKKKKNPNLFLPLNWKVYHFKCYFSRCQRLDRTTISLVRCIHKGVTFIEVSRFIHYDNSFGAFKMWNTTRWGGYVIYKMRRLLTLVHSNDKRCKFVHNVINIVFYDTCSFNSTSNRFCLVKTRKKCIIYFYSYTVIK